MKQNWLRLSIALFTFSLVQHPAVAQLYHFTDLGILPGKASSSATGINSHGDIVGTALSADIQSNAAFIWTAANGMQDLGQPTGGSISSTAAGINDAGQVVGYFEEASGFYRAYMWTSASGMQELGDKPGDTGHFNTANAINNSGQVAGKANVVFLWTSGTGMQALSNPLGSSQAYAISSDGRVGGSTGLIGAIWNTDGTIEYLNPLASDQNSFVTAINSAGQVVGVSAGRDGSHAVIWNADGPKDLGTLQTNSDPSAVYYTYPYGMNNNGLVVGISVNDDAYRAFVWSATAGIQDLSNLMDNSGAGWTLEIAYSINEAGQIVGSA